MLEEDKDLLFMLKVLIIDVIIAAILILFTACTTPKYITVEKEVPVEKIKIEYKTNIKTDSIYVHDSINIYSIGDTIFKTKTKLIYRDKLYIDTIRQTDSIDKPIYIKSTEIKETNKLTKTQKFLGWSGAIAWLLFILFLTLKLKGKLRL